MNRKHLSLVCIILLLTTVFVSACSGQQAGESDADDIKIGFAVVDISMGYWTEQIEGAQAKADELGIELIVQNSDTDPGT